MLFRSNGGGFAFRNGAGGRISSLVNHYSNLPTHIFVLKNETEKFILFFKYRKRFSAEECSKGRDGFSPALERGIMLLFLCIY